jgi:hypothetical protein
MTRAVPTSRRHPSHASQRHFADEGRRYQRWVSRGRESNRCARAAESDLVTAEHLAIPL